MALTRTVRTETVQITLAGEAATKFDSLVSDIKAEITHVEDLAKDIEYGGAQTLADLAADLVFLLEG